MRYAKYVGRVGGLAVALGVGVSIATTPGVAWAGPADSNVSSPTDDAGAVKDSTEPSTPDTDPSAQESAVDTDDDAEVDADALEGEDEGEVDSAPTDVEEDDAASMDTDEDGSGTETDVDPDSEIDPDEVDVEDDADAGGSGGGVEALTEPAKGRSALTQAGTDSNVTVGLADDDVETGVVDVVDQLTMARSPAANAFVAEETTPVALDAPANPSMVVSLVSGVLKWMGALSPLADSGPLGRVESPALWAVAAWSRRQFEQFLSGRASTGPEPLQTSQMLATAEKQARVASAVSAPPTANPTYGAPDPTTGAITGTFNAKSANGNPITYTVSTAPASGSVAVGATGNFVYAPTQAARMRAGASQGEDFDSFIVRVSDGTASTNVRVDVPVYSGQLDAASNSITVGSTPVGVATYGNRAYVSNLAGNSVSVIDTTTGKVVATVKVGSAPTLLTVSSDGKRVYVANRLSNSVSAINTATNTVVKTYKVQSQPQGVAVNKANTRLYVTNSQSGTVSVVNVSTGAIVKNITVGSIPTGITISPDGSRVYVANRGSGNVSVINPSTNTVVSTIKVGASPQVVALNPTGSRLYVTNSGSDNVSVLDTATGATLATIGVGDQPYGIVVSRDGSVAYVANSDFTISAIDLKTNTKIPGKLPMETGVGSMLAMSPDGNTLWTTGTGGRTIRAASLIHINPPPTSQNPNAQAVFEDFNGPAGTLANPALWNYALAGPGGGMQQVYTNSPRNASLDGNGNLVMTAIKEPIFVPGFGTFDYTSAALGTRDKLEFTYGTVSARVKFPAEQGIHPAFFLIGEDDRIVGWPDAGEIDIMEIYSDDAHAGSAIHGPGGYAVSAPAPFAISDEFHEYWVRWEPNKITTGVDNTIIKTFTPEDLPPGAAWTFNDRPMRIVMNLAVGGDSGQPDATTTFPVSVVYDYVRYTPLEGTQTAV